MRISPALGGKAAVKSLAEAIAFNEQHAAEEMPYFGQELFRKAEAKGPLTDKEYLDALAKCRELSREKGIDAVMDKHRLDAVLAPTGGPAWVTDCVNGDHFGGGCSTLPRGGGLSTHHGAGGIRPRTAGGRLVLRPGMERAGPDPAGLRLRASHAPPAPASLPPHRPDLTARHQGPSVHLKSGLP